MEQEKVDMKQEEVETCRWCGNEVTGDYGAGDEFPLWERCLCDVWTLLMKLLAQLRQSGNMTEKEISDFVDFYEEELRCDEKWRTWKTEE